jgi:hypothetical protein
MLLAVFHNVDVRVVDLHAVVAADLHDFVQARIGAVADQLQAAAVEDAFLGAQGGPVDARVARTSLCG